MSEYKRIFDSLLAELRAVAGEIERPPHTDALRMAIESAEAELKVKGGEPEQAALAGFFVGLHYAMWQHVAPLDAKTTKRLKNLTQFKPTVTDQQISAVIRNPAYRTRVEQAAKLGISERALRKRLAKRKAVP